MTETFLTIEEHDKAVEALKDQVRHAETLIRDHTAAMAPLVADLYGITIGGMVEDLRGVRYSVDRVKPRRSYTADLDDPVDLWGSSVVEGRKIRKDGQPSKGDPKYVGLICFVKPVHDDEQSK